MKRTKKSSSNTIKKARRILDSQKQDYQRIFKQELKKGGDSKKAAVRAGSTYRSRYGSTKKSRWSNALKQAKHC